MPRATKTGTTIVGLVFKDGIVLGADTRATGGSTVCDKNCEKIHYIAPNIRCCGAGLLFCKFFVACVCVLVFVVGDILLFVFLMPVIFLKTNFIVVIYPISSFPKALRQILKMLLRWLDDNSNFSVWRQALNPAL